MVALLSFGAGVFCVLMVLGVHTSTWAQGGVENKNAIPTIPNVPLLRLPGAMISGFAWQQLDGMDFSKSTDIRATAIRYAGGNFSFDGTKLFTSRWDFQGPARNTVILLRALGAFRDKACGPPSAFEAPKFLETKADSIGTNIEPTANPAIVTVSSMSR